MKKITYLFLLFFSLNFSNIQAQVVLNELSFGGFLGDFVELKNLGPNTVDVSEYYFFTTAPDGIPVSVSLSSLNLACGTLVMSPDDIIVFDNVSDFIPWQPDLGELALYTTNVNDFEIPDDMIDYLTWGLTPLPTFFTQMVAVAANQWTGGDLVNGNWNGLSIEYDGTGDESSDWPFNNMPTICAENASAGVECEVVAGTPNIGQFDFCVGDGTPDVPTGLAISGNVGTFSQWVVTDVTGSILELPTSVDEVNFENAPEGLCVMWHVVYDGNLIGLEIGGGVMALDGCHEISTPVLISRTQVGGGTLEGGPFEFCVGDDEPDFVTDITLSGNIGTNSQWVITDELGMILGLPDDPSFVNFDEAPAGTCLIWNLSFSGPLTGAAIGENALDLEGCFQLSNPITVNRFGPNSSECGGGSNNNYVLIGFEDLKLERATVLNGGIGVTEEDGDLEITEESEVIAEGTFVNGEYVRVYDRAKASNICAVPAEPVLPDFLYNNTNTTNDQDVDVDDNETIVLTESVYEDIDVDEGATITFSGNEFVYIEELDLGDNVTILFDQCTNLIIEKKLSVGKYNSFNPGEENVFVFVEDDAEVKEGSFFYGGIYTLEKLRIRKAEEETPTIMYGLFIGEDVKARDYVELSAADVLPCQPNIIGGTPYAFVQQEEETEVVAELLNNEDLVIYPNPTKETAFLKVLTKSEQSAQIQIFDMMNKVIFEKTNQAINGAAINIDVSNFSVGLYTAKITLDDGTTLSQKVIVAR